MGHKRTDNTGTTSEGVDWFKSRDGRTVYIGRCCPTYYATTLEGALLGVCPTHRVYGVIQHSA